MIQAIWNYGIAVQVTASSQESPFHYDQPLRPPVPFPQFLTHVKQEL